MADAIEGVEEGGVSAGAGNGMKAKVPHPECSAADDVSLQLVAVAEKQALAYADFAAGTNQALPLGGLSGELASEQDLDAPVKKATRCRIAAAEGLGANSGAASVEAGGKNAGIVENHNIVGSQQAGKVAESAIGELAAAALEVQHTGAVAGRGWLLGDEFVGEPKIEIGNEHDFRVQEAEGAENRRGVGFLCFYFIILIGGSKDCALLCSRQPAAAFTTFGASSMATERKHREEIVRYGRMLHGRGFVAAMDGNLSVRLDRQRVLVTPTCVSKGAMRAADLVIVDMDGKRIAGRRNVTSEIAMHLLIYEMRPDIHAIVHAHPPIATGFAAAGLALTEPLVCEVVVGLGSIPLARYGTPGTDELAQTLEPYVPHHDAILMSNHGVVAYGESLEQAHMRMEIVEHFAQIALVTHLLGKQQPLSGDNLEKLMLARTKYFAGKSALANQQ